MNGKVYLVGAGPGDPGLITVKGQQCIKNADVIIYDYLAVTAHLRHARKDAEMIYVGKKGGDHTLPQEGINALLVEKAKAGNIVTRLKGGDPFIFGRGGEEAEVLIEAGIPYEIVPGVTSAIAGPAYAGIPLTHRKFTATVAFVTGHEDPEKQESNIDWAAISKIGTIVFFMGVKNLPLIVKRLRDNGMPSEKPVALVRWGTTPQQETVTGTLEDIVEVARKAKIKPPSLIVVGDVVTLRPAMKWFEKRPLMGKRIVVTRAREQASDFVSRLADLGADCMECPTIEVSQPDDMAPLDNAIKNIADYDWLVFTSVNGVSFFFDRLFDAGKDVRALNSICTAVIGPATEKRLLDFGIKSDIVPESYRAESVVSAFEKEDIKGKNVLLPRAKEARPILPVELEKMGAAVDEVTAYCTNPVQGDVDIVSRLEEGAVEMLTFTSSSTVTNFKALIPSEKFDTLMAGVKIASIGPITTETAEKLGFNVDITADTYTIPGLCDAICEYFGSEN